MRTMYGRLRRIGRLGPLLGSRSLLILTVFVLAAGSVSWTNERSAQASELAVDWTAPSNTTFRRVSGLGTVQNQPNFLSNIDCTPITYRSATDKIMRNGCFTPTAFGMLDGDNDVIIYNGTDEGVQLDSFGPHGILEPWPDTLNLLNFNPVSTGGTYLGLYKNVPPMREGHDESGRIIRGQVGAPPDILVKDPSGQYLTVNPQTAAFSAGGSWLVIEDYNNSFVRINLATLDTTAFATAFNNPIVQGSGVAVSPDGRFVAIENGNNTTFKVYDLSTCSGGQHNLAAQSCRSYDYWTAEHQQIAGLKYIRHLRFLNDGVLSFEASAASPDMSGGYELSPGGATSSLTSYLGLGDSYTSGEGAFDYLTGTDTADDKCHLSVRSYPLLLTRDLFGATGGHSVACSGAVINDIGSLSGSYRGQVRGSPSYDNLASSGLLSGILAGFTPGYVSQRRFVRQYQPRAVSVSVGGNDIGFGDILQNCVEPHLTLKPSGQNCYSSYESRQSILQLIDRIVPKWTSLYTQLLGDNPAGRLYAIGYPSIAYSDGKCGLNVHLSKSEIAFSNDLIAYLNGDIQRAAQSAGITYVDISHALDGHRLCEAPSYSVAVNGLTAGNDVGFDGINVLGHESYHPNALGQQLIEQAILKQTNNLSLADDPAASGSSAAAPDSSALLNAPKSGAPVYTLLPYSHMTTTVIQTGSGAQLAVDGPSAGLDPNNPYLIKIGGPGGKVLAAVTSDGQGSISASFTVPADTGTGGSTIDVVGAGKTSQPVDVSQPVYIASSPDDFDDDGIANASDSCPYAANSGEDSDGDSVDDGCDSQVGLMGDSSGSSGNTAAGPGAPHVLGLGSISPTNKPDAPAVSLTSVIKSPSADHSQPARAAGAGSSRGSVLGVTRQRPSLRHQSTLRGEYAAAVVGVLMSAGAGIVFTARVWQWRRRGP